MESNYLNKIKKGILIISTSLAINACQNEDNRFYSSLTREEIDKWSVPIVEFEPHRITLGKPTIRYAKDIDHDDRVDVILEGKEAYWVSNKYKKEYPDCKKIMTEEMINKSSEVMRTNRELSALINEENLKISLKKR